MPGPQTLPEDSRPHRGRPPQPAGTTRGNRIVTMVTDLELAQLTLSADARQMSMSSFIQEILCEHLQSAE